MAETKFEYLPKLIRRTRLAHIHAEKRFLALDVLAKHATVYYACWTTVLSLTTLYADCSWLSPLAVACSIVVALCSVFASSQNYAVRAERMKISYISLQELWLEFDSDFASDEERASFADEAGRRYVAILKQTENHCNQDDIENRSDLAKLKWNVLRISVYSAPCIVCAAVIFLGL